MPVDPLGPLAAILYVTVLVSTTLATMRRPIAGVCALIVLQPFAFYSDILGTTVTLPKVALVGVALGCIAYPGAFDILRARAPSRIFLAGILIVAATALSAAQAANLHAVFREIFKAMEYVVLFATVYAAYRLEPNREIARVAIVATTALVALISLSQEFFGAPSVLLMNGHTTPRIAGPLEGPNQLAGYLDISLPLLFAFCVERSEPAIQAALSLAMFADVLTLSRGGALGTVAGIAAVALTYRARDLRHAFVFTGIGLAAGTVVAASWGLVAHSLGLFRLWTLARTDEAGGVGTRPELWHAAIALIRHHALLGVGAGNFELELPLAGLHGVRTHANSLYLQALVEGGIPQLVATFYLAYVSISTFVRERARSPLIAGALGASIALALHQIFDYLVFYPKVGGWWWIILALGAAELTRAERTVPQCA
ncbi:MAG: O-antigen ligase family protein [Vulcanimicrobiaceae bacterium]